MLTAVPEKLSRALPRAGSRSKPVPTGTVPGGQLREAAFCVEGFTGNGLSFNRVSFRSGLMPRPTRIRRHETATVTCRLGFVTGFPKRNAYVRSPAGRMLNVVTPGAAVETPPLTATYPGGHVTVKPVTEF